MKINLRYVSENVFFFVEAALSVCHSRRDLCLDCFETPVCGVFTEALTSESNLFNQRNDDSFRCLLIICLPGLILQHVSLKTRTVSDYPSQADPSGFSLCRENNRNVRQPAK